MCLIHTTGYFERNNENCDPKRKGMAFYKTFFIQKLLDVDHTTKAGQYSFQGVKTISQKETIVPGKDIFAFDQLVIPLHLWGEPLGKSYS
jgi:hypothetical protein